MDLTQIPINGTWSQAQKAIQDNFTSVKNQFSSLPLVVVINTDRPNKNNDCTRRLVDVHSIKPNVDYPVGIFLSEGGHSIIMALSNLDYGGQFEGNTNVNSSQFMHNVITAFDGQNRTKDLDITKDPAKTCLKYTINKLVNISGANATTPDNLIQMKNNIAKDLGKWWIPSVGELFLIFKNYDAINAVLTELNNKTYKADGVNGVTKLRCTLLEKNALYWTSVPTSGTGMWRIMRQSRGLLIGGASNSSTGFIRPVTNLDFNS